MFLSAKAEYACLALLELAVRHGQPKPIRLSEVAEKHGLKKPFLVQILLQLKGAGLVASTRGATGGLADGTISFSKSFAFHANRHRHAPLQRQS